MNAALGMTVAMITAACGGTDGLALSSKGIEDKDEPVRKSVSLKRR